MILLRMSLKILKIYRYKLMEKDIDVSDLIPKVEKL